VSVHDADVEVAVVVMINERGAKSDARAAASAASRRANVSSAATFVAPIQANEGGAKNEVRLHVVGRVR
jgi:uncharacterized membrane-anchored protein